MLETRFGNFGLVWLAARCLSRGDGLQFGQCDMMKDNIGTLALWESGKFGRKERGRAKYTIRFAINLTERERKTHYGNQADTSYIISLEDSRDSLFSPREPINRQSSPIKQNSFDIVNLKPQDRSGLLIRQGLPPSTRGQRDLGRQRREGKARKRPRRPPRGI